MKIVGSIYWYVDRSIGAVVYRGIHGEEDSGVYCGFGINTGWEVEWGFMGEVISDNDKKIW